MNYYYYCFVSFNLIHLCPLKTSFKYANIYKYICSWNYFTYFNKVFLFYWMLCTRSRRKGTSTAVLFLIDCWHLYKTMAPASTLSGAILHLLFSNSMAPERPSKNSSMGYPWLSIPDEKKKLLPVHLPDLGIQSFLLPRAVEPPSQLLICVDSSTHPMKY